MIEDQVYVPTHERLLSREQIEAIDDLESLVALQDDVTERAKVIEVDLEFRTDDRADEEWEQRARRALAAHYACNGHLARRIKFLRGHKPAKDASNEGKARRREAAAQLLAAQTAAKRAKAEQQREVTARTLAAHAARQSVLAFFHAVVVEEMGAKWAGARMGVAKRRLEEAMLSDIGTEQPEGTEA